ncbi:hypothetical protein E2C01_065181 [Portunus trituberculatus]|uniref:Uncharacterized protein n=1 Tax=Portunus trituberculatus TaxID=210409 RepID=A0A5B7HMB7_PORTR|nr:hypothetical protein [Portunus trituberculatus]
MAAAGLALSRCVAGVNCGQAGRTITVENLTHCTKLGQVDRCLLCEAAQERLLCAPRSGAEVNNVSYDVNPARCHV